MYSRAGSARPGGQGGFGVKTSLRLGTVLGFNAFGQHVSLGPGVEGIEIRRRNTLGHQPRPEPGNRVVFFTGLLDFFGGSVGPLVVGIGMAVQALDLKDDDGGFAVQPHLGHNPAKGVVANLGVPTVDPLNGDAVELVGISIGGLIKGLSSGFG